MRLFSKTVILSKFKESILSVAPITAIVLVLGFFVIPVPNELMMSFLVGAGMLTVGMGLFTLGTDLAMTPVGSHVGSAVTKSRKLWFIVLICFLVGCIVTMSEPDLQVLAGQVPGIPNLTMVLAVSLGVGLFLVVAILRILFNIRLSYLLIGFYAAAFALAAFVPPSFLSVAFDAGGVTTGPMTVPFILSLGTGIAAIRGDENAENDSFGLVALCSVGPIIAVMLLALIFGADSAVYTPPLIPAVPTTRDLAQLFNDAYPTYLKEVAEALLPIMLFFAVFQIFRLRLGSEPLTKILMGFVYTYVGLVLFLTGANVGFMPVGTYIGQCLGSIGSGMILVPVGMLIGYFIVVAEPAVHVLREQVFEMTSGAIPPAALTYGLCIGVALSIGLSMLRIVLGIPVMYILIPGYLLAIVLSFFVPPIFTAIAFDSGGVASGPMTAAFLLPLAIGAATALERDVIRYAFGVVALVAMTPLITIQLLGLYYKLKTGRQVARERQALILSELSDTTILYVESEDAV